MTNEMKYEPPHHPNPHENPEKLSTYSTLSAIDIVFLSSKSNFMCYKCYNM